MKRPSFAATDHIVTLVLKCRICHLAKWQIRHFNTKGINITDELGMLDTMSQT